MDKALKQRMVGAVVLIALGVIFIPMLLDGGSGENGERSVELEIPAAPDREYRSRRLPLGESGGSDSGESRGEVERPAESRPDTSDGTGEVPQPEPADGDGTRDEPAEPEDGDISPGETAGDDGSGDASPEPEPEPEPASAGSGDGDAGEQSLVNWFVQVGSFSQESNAVELRDRLRNAGYAAFVESSTVEGKTTHRVRIGPEMDRSRAESKRDEIRSEFDLKGIVISEP